MAHTSPCTALAYSLLSASSIEWWSIKKEFEIKIWKNVYRKPGIIFPTTSSFWLLKTWSKFLETHYNEMEIFRVSQIPQISPWLEGLPCRKFILTVFQREKTDLHTNKSFLWNSAFSKTGLSFLFFFLKKNIFFLMSWLIHGQKNCPSLLYRGNCVYSVSISVPWFHDEAKTKKTQFL